MNDPYINNGIQDSRTNHVREFILSEPLDDSSTIITIEGNPEGVRMEKGRRLLQIDNELVTYENYTTEPPYQFTYGEYLTQKQPHMTKDNISDYWM